MRGALKPLGVVSPLTRALPLPSSTTTRPLVFPFYKFRRFSFLAIRPRKFDPSMRSDFVADFPWYFFLWTFPRPACRHLSRPPKGPKPPPSATAPARPPKTLGSTEPEWSQASPNRSRPLLWIGVQNANGKSETVSPSNRQRRHRIHRASGPSLNERMVGYIKCLRPPNKAVRPCMMNAFVFVFTMFPERTIVSLNQRRCESQRMWNPRLSRNAFATKKVFGNLTTKYDVVRVFFKIPSLRSPHFDRGGSRLRQNKSNLRAGPC